MQSARVNEIFYSYQGEGVYQGAAQVFIRFSGCNLKCSFCDTDTQKYNFYSIDDLLQKIDLISAGRNIHSISITGGEPLCQCKFLMEFLPRLKQSGYRVYLETNGTLPGALPDLMPYIDIIAMDFKLPSSTRERPFWKQHDEFLKIALSKDVFVKAVITDKTTLNDWESAVNIIYRISPHIPLILQPVTSVNACKAPSNEKIAIFKAIGLEKLDRIEVRGQLHSLLGIR